MFKVSILLAAAQVILFSVLGKADAQQGSQHSKSVIGYYASWQWYDRSGLAKPSNMDFTKVTRVNFAFFQVDAAGNIWGTDSWADPQVLFGPQNWNPAPDAEQQCSWTSPTGKTCSVHKTEEGLIGLAHAAGAEVYPSLGGWTLSDAFVPMAANPESRERFADKCVELIKDYGFDGIDIDWEYPGYEDHSGTPEDTQNYNLLLDILRIKLDALGEETNKYYGITAALPCGPSNIANIDIAHVSTKLDELNLMTYDFAGTWDSVTGVNAPIYHQGWGPDEFSLDDCVKNWLDGGGTRDQINIGLPFYGRSFGSASGLNQPFNGADMAHFRIDEGTPQYFNIVPQLGSMTSVRHEPTKTQYAYFNDGSGFVSYDNEQAICDKTGYVLENELKGFIIWELSGDLMPDLSTPLLDAVNNKLANPEFTCGEPGPPVDIPVPAPMTPAPMMPDPLHPAPPAPTPIAPAPSHPNQELPTPIPPHEGTCGGGNFGNGVCSNGLCCSNWGFCGSTPAHCGTNTPPPVDIPDNTDDNTDDNADDDDDVPHLAPPRMTPSPTPAPQTTPDDTPQTPPEEPGAPCCPQNFSGLRAYNQCTQFFHCANGNVVGNPMDVAPGTLFDNNYQTQNFASMVTCENDSTCEGAVRKLRGSVKSSAVEVTNVQAQRMLEFQKSMKGNILRLERETSSKRN